jgi:hypothetical protein
MELAAPFENCLHALNLFGLGENRTLPVELDTQDILIFSLETSQQMRIK